MNQELPRTGISVVGDAPWGVHFSLFYDTQNDLLDAIVPYFAEGLEAHELCVWAPSEPSVEKAAIAKLRERVADFDHYLSDKSFESFCYEDFFKPDGRLDIAAALAQWEKWDQRAHDQGYSGLRGSGNLSWVKKESWAICHEYEQAVNDFIIGRRMLVLCCYPLASTAASDILDSAREHSFVIARRNSEWDTLEVPALARTKEELKRVNDELEQRVQQRNTELTAINKDLRRQIDERQRAEHALSRSETYLRHGQRLSQTGSFAGTFHPWNLTYWSAETFRIFGLEPRDRPPDRAELFSLFHPADRARVEAVIDDTERTGHGVDVELRIVRSDGSIRHIHCVCTPLTDDSGQLTEFVGTVIDITEQKRAAQRLVRVKREARERTLRARFTAVLEERTRLARDIHDTLLQGVTGIALQLRATLPHLGAAPHATVDSIRRIVELAESTIRDARRAVWDIRIPALVRSDLPTALEQEVRHRASGVAIQFDVRGTPRRLPAVVEDTIFRIGQEAVINAAAHSGARTVSVSLVYEPRSTRLIVHDDGRGFLVEPVGQAHGGHWGLLGMRERAERLDAPLVIRSAENAGTTVELRVPLSGKTARRTASTPHHSDLPSTSRFASPREVVANVDTRADS
jgi:PAS domain S-box-containing protein